MQLNLPTGQSVHLIGDPHIGRPFQTGVPHHKRGQREARQLTLLRDELMLPDIDYNICVGDLFDHPHVGYKVVLDVANLYLEAVEANAYTKYLVMAGNHDLPRNIETVGAFDDFEAIVQGRYDNLVVVRRPWWDKRGQLLLLPWEWNRSASEQLPVGGMFQGYTAIGHWDLQSYGGDDSHLAPTQELHDLGVTEIYSGHYHIEGAYPVNGHVVNCTGSLEPYSHGEDPEGRIYVTLSLEEATDGRDLSQNCVRVVLKDGEEIPDDLDCMALTAIKEKLVAEEGEQVSLGKFEWKTVLEEALADLDPDVREFIQERLSA